MFSTVAKSIVEILHERLQWYHLCIVSCPCVLIQGYDSMCFCLFPMAAVTNDHILSDETTQIYYLIVCESEINKGSLS